MKGFKRRSFAAGCAALALLALPAAASAEVRMGHAADPSGDGKGALSQDIISASVLYDSSGAVSATATMSAAVGTTPRSLFRFTLASFTAPATCAGPSTLLSAFSDSWWTTAPLGTAGDEVQRQGLSLTVNASGASVRNRPYSCLTLTVSDMTGTVMDQLDVPLYFDGAGPDGDGDGVVDNVDQCPTVPGPAAGCVPDSDGDGVVDAADQCPAIFGIVPGGCPASAPLPGPPGIVTTLPAEEKPAPAPACSRVAVKGKSLAAARKAIAKAGCKVGKVSKPRKVSKGAKLVVVKQSGRDPVAITLAAAKR